MGGGRERFLTPGSWTLVRSGGALIPPEKQDAGFEVAQVGTKREKEEDGERPSFSLLPGRKLDGCCNRNTVFRIDKRRSLVPRQQRR